MAGNDEGVCEVCGKQFGGANMRTEAYYCGTLTPHDAKPKTAKADNGEAKPKATRTRKATAK